MSRRRNKNKKKLSKLNNSDPVVPIQNDLVNPDYSDRVLMKAVRDMKKQKEAITAGVASPKGFSTDPYMNIHYSGVVQQQYGISDELLRRIEGKNPLIAAIYVTRQQQVRRFAKVSNNPDVPGFRIRLKDRDKKISKDEKAEARFIEEWLLNTGRTDYDGWYKRKDNLFDWMKKYVRESYTIDKIANEVVRDKRGEPAYFKMLDAATIKPVLEGGFRGHKSDIDPRVYFSNDPFYKKITDSKIDQIPEINEITHVQELSGRFVAAFTHNDLVYEIINERVDVKYTNQGYSRLERANTAIVAFINSLRYNIAGQDRSAIPKIAMAMGEKSNFTQEELEDLAEEWHANFNGPEGMQRMPFLNGNVKILDLIKSNRDMEYHKFLEFVGAIICAEMGIDPSEMGLRFNMAQNVMNENQDAKQKYSKSRGLYDTLLDMENTINKILRIAKPEWADKYYFEFTGLDPQDKAENSRLRKEAVETHKTVNQVLAEEDQDPIPFGDIILNSQYIQYRMAQEAKEQQQPGIDNDDIESQGEDDEDEDWNIEDDIDEIVDKEMGKARTLLV